MEFLGATVCSRELQLATPNKNAVRRELLLLTAFVEAYHSNFHHSTRVA
jgi:hypothetical protein